MDKLIEKRHHERMNHNSMATLESLQIGVYENNRMVNCSDNGLYFESDQFLLPGAEVFVRIENFPHSQTGNYKCHHVKIKWGKRLKNTPYGYGYGAKYVDLSNEQNSLETDSDQIKDLRNHPRKYYDKPATFGFENKSYDGFIKNISRNGCFIENREFLNIGQILELVIPGTIFNENNMLKVEVMRLSPSGVGVKFKSIIKDSLSSKYRTFLLCNAGFIADKGIKSDLKNQSIKVLLIFIFNMALLFGCSATKSGLSDNHSSVGKRNYERIVYGNKGNPILKIVCKYIGKKPVAGFETDVHWETIDTDFYNLSFHNLTDKRIEFISSKVYQSLPGEIAKERNLPVKQSAILIEHKDYRKVHDPKFDPLEYRGERTLINWPIQTNNLYPHNITNIIFRIKYMEQEYRFNILMVYEK